MQRAKYVQRIETAIKESCRRVIRYRDCFSREEHARYWLIDPMLSALGWDVGDPGQVFVEYAVGGSQGRLRPDYVFFKPSTDEPKDTTPRMIVEAKAITPGGVHEFLKWKESSYLYNVGDLEDWSQADVDQLDGYVRESRMNSGYGVLTDGLCWCIYEVRKDGSGLKQKYLDHFHILFEDPSFSADKLKMLHHRNMGS